MSITIPDAIGVRCPSSSSCSPIGSDCRFGVWWSRSWPAEAFGQADSDFGPHCVIEDPRVVLDPLQITNLPRDLLGPPVLSLAGEDTRIINAMDALLSRAWR